MTGITINGIASVTGCRTVCELRDSRFPDCEVIVLNGYGLTGDREIRNGDSVHFCKKGWLPERNELDALISARDTPNIHGILKGSRVGIAGLGGLGSNIAAMLARAGIGHMVIADFDTVDPTNLNRQNYFIRDIGMAKTDATERMISEINPFIDVVKFCGRIDAGNSGTVFGDCSIVCEAFDSPSEKAMLINALSEGCPDIELVSGSGMAGFEDSNLIRTERKFRNLCICGDAANDAKEGMGLMAPRVSICAGHMANAVVRILIGKKV